MKSAGRILQPFFLAALSMIAVSWIIPNWPRILEFLSILRIFALLVICLAVGTAITVLIFWSLKQRFGLRVLELRGSKKRLGISLFLTFAIVLSGALLELFGYKAASFFYPIEDRLEAFSNTQNIVILLMVLLVLVDIVLTVSVLLESAAGAWKKRIIFLVGCTVFMILVNIVLTRLELFNSYWFENLSRIRKPSPPPAQDVAILDFYFGWPGKEEFLSTLSILEKEQPRAIVFIFPMDLHFRADSADASELRNTIPVERLVISAYDRKRGLREAMLGENMLKPDPIAESRIPMYIRLIKWRHSLGDDFAVAAMKLLARNQGQSQEVRIDKGVVEIGEHRIPMNWDSRMLIKYYSTFFYSRSWNLAFPFVTIRYLHYPGEGAAIVRLGTGQFTMASVNFDRQRFEYIPMVERGTSTNIYYEYDSSRAEVFRLPEIKDKILIVNVSSQFTGIFSESQPWKSPAYVYATAIQNILAKDFLVETTLAKDLILSIVVLVFLWYFYGRWGAWWGLVVTVGTGIVLSFLLLLVFSNFDLFVGPASVAVPLIASLVSFFPFEIVTDRRRILEEQTRLTTELRAAREMQMGLMPKEDPIVPGFDIAGICVPANEVGGDFFDYVWLDEKKAKLGIAVADVSGKAMRAAITAVMTSGMIYQEIGNGESPKKILRKINKPLYAKIDDHMFTALSFAVLDVKKKELRFSNAGQMYPALTRRGRVIMLEVKGARLPLGIKENVLYEEMIVRLKKGDTVIFYTDGIPEAKNEKDEFYGFDRFKTLAGGIEGASAKETRDRILEDVKSFTGKSPQYDDMTVVVVKVGDHSVA